MWKQLSKTEEGLAVIRQGCPLCLLPNHVRPDTKEFSGTGLHKRCSRRGLDRARFLQTMPTRSLIWNTASDAHRGSEKKTFILMQWVTFVLGKNRFSIKIEMMYPHMFVKNKSILLTRKVIRVLLPAFIPTVRPQWLDYNSNGHGGPSLNTWECRIKYKCYIKFTIYCLIYTY